MTQIPQPKTPHVSGLNKNVIAQGDVAPGICASLHYYKHGTAIRRSVMPGNTWKLASGTIIITTNTTTEVLKTRIT
jgi:hypothetical protein